MRLFIQAIYLSYALSYLKLGLR